MESSVWASTYLCKFQGTTYGWHTFRGMRPFIFPLKQWHLLVYFYVLLFFWVPDIASLKYFLKTRTAMLCLPACNHQMLSGYPVMARILRHILSYLQSLRETILECGAELWRQIGLNSIPALQMFGSGILGKWDHVFQCAKPFHGAGVWLRDRTHGWHVQSSSFNTKTTIRQKKQNNNTIKLIFHSSPLQFWVEK